MEPPTHRSCVGAGHVEVRLRPTAAEGALGVSDGPMIRSMLAGSELVAFVATVDLERARAFYADRLGLRLVEQTTFACVFAAGAATLRVAAATTVVAAPYTVVGWTVPGIDATIGWLGAQGIDLLEFDGLDQDPLGIWTSPGGARVAWFHDPDGNILSVTQPSC